MPSPVGWRDVPCIECGTRVAGIDFAERCPACQGKRERRARTIGRRAALAATVLVGAWTLWQLPASPVGRWYAAIGIPATYALVRLVAGRFALELIK